MGRALGSWEWTDYFRVMGFILVCEILSGRLKFQTYLEIVITRPIVRTNSQDDLRLKVPKSIDIRCGWSLHFEDVILLSTTSFQLSIPNRFTISCFIGWPYELKNPLIWASSLSKKETKRKERKYEKRERVGKNNGKFEERLRKRIWKTILIIIEIGRNMGTYTKMYVCMKMPLRYY